MFRQLNKFQQERAQLKNSLISRYKVLKSELSFFSLKKQHNLKSQVLPYRVFTFDMYAFWYLIEKRNKASTFRQNNYDSEWSKQLTVHSLNG